VRQVGHLPRICSSHAERREILLIIDIPNFVLFLLDENCY